MSEVGTEISTLLDSTVKAAPKITSPLKKIGDGDMLKGIRTIFNFAMEEGFAKGERSGMIKGSVGTLLGVGAIYGGYQGIKKIGKYIAVKKNHQIEGEKILEALQETTKINSNNCNQCVESEENANEKVEI